MPKDDSLSLTTTQAAQAIQFRNNFVTKFVQIHRILITVTSAATVVK